MQNQKNCYENVWILSGTSDGPILVNKLLKLNFIVFVSVVTPKACDSYSKNPKLHIITGKLNDSLEIINFIKKNKIKFVVDATHPFAEIISKNLNKACKEINMSLLVFNRKLLIKNSNNFNYISDLRGIDKNHLKNKNILLAIGSKYLDDTAKYYMNFGANVFARVLPTSESISKAFSSCVKNSNIAILAPSKNMENNLEKQLCFFWKIDIVLCRESGSYSQKLWEKIITESNKKLFLVKRPLLEYSKSNSFFDHDSLINFIKGEY